MQRCATAEIGTATGCSQPSGHWSRGRSLKRKLDHGGRTSGPKPSSVMRAMPDLLHLDGSVTGHASLLGLPN